MPMSAQCCFNDVASRFHDSVTVNQRARQKTTAAEWSSTVNVVLLIFLTFAAVSQCGRVALFCVLTAGDSSAHVHHVNAA